MKYISINNEINLLLNATVALSKIVSVNDGVIVFCKNMLFPKIDQGCTPNGAAILRPEFEYGRRAAWR